MTRGQTLIQWIKTQIQDGTLAAGDRLPSITTLCEQHQVSSTTVRLALRDLTSDGFLESRPGSGFFVRRRQTTPSALDVRKLFAIVVPAAGNYFYAEIFRGAEEACRAKGYRLVIAYSNESADSEAQQIVELCRQVAGLLVIPVSTEGRYSAYAELMENGVPFVFVDCRVHRLAASCVSTDNEQGGYLATRHLIEQGCRRIVAISERPVSSLEDRLTGHRRAIREAGLPWSADLVRKTPLRNDEAGYALTRDLLRETPLNGQRLGIFALNVAIAHGCYVAIKEAGLRIPQDIAVTGFDEDFAPFLDPPLSTVRQNPRRIGGTAVDVLIEELRDGSRAAPRFVKLSPDFIIRGSSDETCVFSPSADLARRVQEHTAAGVT